MPKAFIGIGSNIGNRVQHLENAIQRLSERRVSIMRRSTIIETEPWGVTDQPPFLNMVIEIETDLNPGELLALLKSTERTLGRTATVRWGPRVIDLDILLYDDSIIKTPALEIPHPGMCEREFVLRPLAEIAPDVIHPVVGKSIKTLLEEVVGSQ